MRPNIGIVYCPFTLVVGAKIEFSAEVWTAEWMWEMIRQGRATVVVDQPYQPSRYRDLADFYCNNLTTRPQKEKDVYLLLAIHNSVRRCDEIGKIFLAPLC